VMATGGDGGQLVANLASYVIGHEGAHDRA